MKASRVGQYLIIIVSRNRRSRTSFEDIVQNCYIDPGVFFFGMTNQGESTLEIVESFDENVLEVAIRLLFSCHNLGN